MLQEYTEEELIIEFLEDVIEIDPTEAFAKKEDHYFAQTGDPLIDKWELELAAGKEIDFTEGLEDAEAKADFEKLLKYSKQEQVTKKPKDDTEEEIVNKTYG